MSWSVWVTIQELEQLASWSVIRNGVWGWSQAVKGVFAVLVCDELPSKVAILLVLVLLLIQAVCGSLPDIDRCIGQGLLCFCTVDCAMHVHDLGIFGGIEGDSGALFSDWVIVAEEGAQDGALGRQIRGFGGLLVGDFVYQPANVSLRQSMLITGARHTIPSQRHRRQAGLRFSCR